MTYWLLIILIFSPQWELKGIQFRDAHESRQQCIEVMTESAKYQPDHSHLHCFPANIPLPAYRLPAHEQGTQYL